MLPFVTPNNLTNLWPASQLSGTATLNQGGGVPSWVPRDASGRAAVAVLDAANDRGWFKNVAYPTETSFLAAIGGSKSGVTRTIGPYVAPDAPELVSNGSFLVDTTGWNAQNSATLAVAGGQLQVTGNGGNTPGFSQQVALLNKRAYRSQVRMDRSGGGLSVQAMVSSSAPNSPTMSGCAGPSLGGAGDFIYYVAGVPANIAYVGGRLNANPANGTALFDNLSIKECIPYETFVPELAALLVEATTPASIAAAQVVLQLDENGTTTANVAQERNRVRLVYGTDNHLHLIVTADNTQYADLDLGIVAVSTAFKVALSASENAFTASLNGGTAVSDTSGNMPGLAILRMGRSATGETWTGTIEKVSQFANALTATEAENLSGSPLAAWGDSLTFGTGKTAPANAYPAVEAAALKRAVYNGGVGGETSTQIAARFFADTTMRSRVCQFWPGRNNFTDPVTVKADIAAMVAALGHSRYLVGSILPWTTDGVLASTRIQLNADLAAIYGPRFVDVDGALKAANDGSANDLSDVAAGWTPRSLRSDNGHLNDAGYVVAEVPWRAAVVANGF